MELTDEKFAAREIHFCHEKPDDISSHKKIFNTEIYFSREEVKLVFDKTYLDYPIYLANDILLENLQQFAREQLEVIHSGKKWTHHVKQGLVKNLLNGDKPSLQSLASDQFMSSRSLQLKLKSESTTYQEVLDELRKELAVQYISKPGMSLNDLAFLLAFSDQSAFSHAFKRWTGKSPLEYRKNNK